MDEETKYQPMTLKQFALYYKFSIPTFKKWIKHYLPELNILPNSYLFTPEQEKKIIEELG